MNSQRFRSWATTHPGTVRKHNEDAFVNRPELGLFAVADGAGGHARGDLASHLIAEALDAIDPGLSPVDLVAEVASGIARTHASLRRTAAQQGPEAMIASTVVVLVLAEDSFTCLWAGDSRAYQFRDGKLHRLSRDHSLVQELVDAGSITAAEAESHPRANVITRAVGADGASMELEQITGPARPGDRFLLCSDGLYKQLADESLERLLAAPGDRPLSDLLIEAALANEARDNVTAVVVEFP